MRTVRAGFSRRCSFDTRTGAGTARRALRRGALALCIAGLAVTACHRQPTAQRGASASGAPDAVMTPYLAIHDALAKDSMEGLGANASAIATAARTIGGQASRLGSDAQSLQSATTLADARAKFGTLSETLVSDAQTSGWKLPAGVREAYCPMAAKPWLQRGSTIANPYYGQEMPTCGEFK